MENKIITGLIALVAIVVAVIFAGCIHRVGLLGLLLQCIEMEILKRVTL